MNANAVLQEMYFRHLYASTQPTLMQRCDSYDNYCALFNVVLMGNVNMQVCFPGLCSHRILPAFASLLTLLPSLAAGCICHAKEMNPSLLLHGWKLLCTMDCQRGR